MIAVDTSALMAILLGEALSDACMDALEAESDVLLSAVTFAETLIVAARRHVRDEVEGLVERLGFSVVPVTAAAAVRVAEAYARWGKGVHPVGLNFGDCFAYDIARSYSCALLFVGDDFSRTDVVSVLRPPS